MAKIKDETKPNRQMIEALFKDLWNSCRSYTDDGDSDRQAYQQLNEQIEELKEKLLDNPKLKALEKQSQAAHKRSHARGQLRREKVNRVHRKYLANGVTDAILKELNAVVAELNEAD